MEEIMVAHSPRYYTFGGNIAYCLTTIFHQCCCWVRATLYVCTPNSDRSKLSYPCWTYLLISKGCWIMGRADLVVYSLLSWSPDHRLKLLLRIPPHQPPAIYCSSGIYVKISHKYRWFWIRSLVWVFDRDLSIRELLQVVYNGKKILR